MLRRVLFGAFGLVLLAAAVGCTGSSADKNKNKDKDRPKAASYSPRLAGGNA